MAKRRFIWRVSSGLTETLQSDSFLVEAESLIQAAKLAESKVLEEFVLSKIEAVGEVR